MLNSHCDTAALFNQSINLQPNVFYHLNNKRAQYYGCWFIKNTMAFIETKENAAKYEIEIVTESEWKWHHQNRK